MLERTRERLRHLHRKRRLRIVGQPMVLTALICELGLQEEFFASRHSRAKRCGHAFADGCLKVMSPLVRRVYGAESRSQCEFGQSSGSIFFPRGAIQEVRLR